MAERVVITGMGVVAANAHGLDAFETALRDGRSGVRFQAQLRDLEFGCQVAGVPDLSPEVIHRYFPDDILRSMNTSMTYAGMAAIDCWTDAGFAVPGRDSDVDWDTGAMIGTGVGGLDTVGTRLVPGVNQGKVKRLGSSLPEQTMASAASASVGGLLALGGAVTTNSSACTTGTEAVVNGYFAVREGRVSRVLAGGTEGASAYTWGAFDAMRVLARQANDRPEEASRPMSASACGFVPSAGAAVLLLESLTAARGRGARIYAEVLGGHVNCGGQRNGGSMTAPNPEGSERCIRRALACAGVDGDAVDAINGHLTATMADSLEIGAWQRALQREPEALPHIQATKSLIGHALGAAGAIESVVCVLELSRGFIHGSRNCEDLHPALARCSDRIPRVTLDVAPRIVAKGSFGFGDVNGCVIFGRWDR